MNSLEITQGGLAVDDRGSVSFINDFDLSKFKRFYSVQNHSQGFIRAWHGHKNESKSVVVMRGSALVCAVKVDDWENPSPNLDVQRYVLSDQKPTALHIPAGYANGFMNLSSDSIICFFSNSSLEQSLGDDIRFDSKFWNPWHIEER